eukprot:1580931-Pyramimonas_sp.AAC.1
MLGHSNLKPNAVHKYGTTVGMLGTSLVDGRRWLHTNMSAVVRVVSSQKGAVPVRVFAQRLANLARVDKAVYGGILLAR